MPIVIKMPKLSDTMETGAIVNWLKQEGDAIEPGDVIAEVESDKATMELEAYDEGVIVKILAKPGDALPVGAPLAVLGESADEDISGALAEAEGGGAPAAAPEAKEVPKPARSAPSIPPAESTAIVVKMPKLSDAMESGTIVHWAKLEGEPLEAGDIIAEVESDTATTELEAFDSGVMLRRLARANETLAPGTPLAIVGANKDEDISGLLASLGVMAPPAVSHPASTPASGGRILASPVASRMATEFGLDLRLIQGTGPGGRIVKRDIEKAKAEGRTAPAGAISSTPPVPAAPPVSGDEFIDAPNSQMRRVIAQRLTESKSQIPHYYLTVDVGMNQVNQLRKQINELDGVRVSVNDFVIKAVAMALQGNPAMNSSYQGDHTRVYNRVDIGVAVAMEDGLITPVVRDADLKGLGQISEEVRELAMRARDKKLKPEEFTGSTFTISNLGMYGIKHFTAVINPPEAGILAVGAVRDDPVVVEGEVFVSSIMSVTLSSDHRAVDGAQSAQFLADFKYFLENPIAFAL